MELISWIRVTIETKLSDYISVVAIIVNSILAIWIVNTIQNKLTNKRVLKDHFISEIKDIRNIYRDKLNLMHSNKCHAQHLLPWLKLMNIKISDLMKLINNRYNIDIDFFKPYQLELRVLITDNQDFINHFESDEPILFSAESKGQIIKFRQDYNHLFNDAIVMINDE